MPFKNKAGFDNKNWDIAVGIPAAFADSLGKLGHHQVVPPSKLNDYLRKNKIRTYQYEKAEILHKIAEQLNLDYLVGGDIDEFGLSRVNVGNFLVGGYESYRAEIKVKFYVYDFCKKEKSENYYCFSDVKRKDIGISLIGRPSPYYISFRELDKLEFNSPEFNQTIMGEAVKQLTGDFISKFVEVVPGLAETSVIEQPDLTVKFSEAKIVFKRENEVYINAGRSDNIAVGDVLPVYTPGEPISDPDSRQVLGYADKYIGKIKIFLIKDEHLSMAKIIEQRQTIKVKDKVRIKNQ